jgi:hypothetical protein
MRQYVIAAVIMLFSACNNSTPKKIIPAENKVEEKTSFFPVTSYLKGQVHEIKEKGLTPIKYTTINNHTDSVAIKFEMLDELVKEFLQPEIDTTNLISFFAETKFLDQTIDAFTFTYDAKSPIPDSLNLRHWDVYIDPATSKVKRVYIIKKSGENKTMQLTWQSNLWCKTTTIINNPDGTSTIEKEEKISWAY